MAIGALIPSLPPIASTASQIKSIGSALGIGKKSVQKPWDQAFMFDCAGEAWYQGGTEITDNVIENGTYAHDHIAVKPIVMTLSGFTGLVTMTRSQIQGGLLGSMANLVGSIPAYAGKYTPKAAATIAGAISQAQSIATQIGGAVSQINSVLAILNPNAPNKAQRAFLQLEALKNAGTVFSIVVPFLKEEVRADGNCGFDSY